MNSELEWRLAEFVDRQAELSRFCSILDSSDKLVFIVRGEGGIGKSSLLARMIRECMDRGITRSELTWTDTQSHDYLAIMRRIRDDAGPQFFNSFTAQVNRYFDPAYKLTVSLAGTGHLKVLENADIRTSTLGDVAGIILKDCNISLPRSDMAVPEAERMIRLTEEFLAGLRAVLNTKRVVLFLDAAEKMTDLTHKWLWGELVHAVRAGTLPNLMIVYCGRLRPVLDRFIEMIVEDAELGPLGQSDISEYLSKRGVPEQGREEIAAMLLVVSKGLPSAVASTVDAYLELKRKKVH